jgi:RNA polymerase sigma factor (TIGR02999 family)
LCSNQTIESEDRQHLLAICGRCIRQVLVEHSRRKNALKRGGDKKFMTLHEEACGNDTSKETDYAALDESLKRLETLDKTQARVVELRFYAGRTIEEIAKIMNLSESTIKRKWMMAKAWLYKEINR